MSRRNRQCGATMLEFVLTGVPLLFIWIGIAQMAIGMWTYHTLQYAVKAAGAYTSVHGVGCTQNGNTCSITIKNAAAIIQTRAPGLIPTATTLTFGAIAADHITAVGTPVICRLDNCLTNNTAWPLSGYASPGQEFSIFAEYQFNSALAMVAPGPGAGVVRFGSVYFPGYTHQIVLF